MVNESNESKIDSQLSNNVSQYSREAQRIQAINLLVTENNDSLQDLSEEQIKAISLFRSFNDNILPVPEVMDFLDNFGSLSRSRDRMGRQEYKECHDRPINYNVNRHDFAETEQQQVNTGGFFSKLKGNFGRRRSS